MALDEAISLGRQQLSLLLQQQCLQGLGRADMGMVDGRPSNSGLPRSPC